MQFFLALFVWIVLAVVLGVALFATAVFGKAWALPLAMIAYLFMFYHYGCKTH